MITHTHTIDWQHYEVIVGSRTSIEVLKTLPETIISNSSHLKISPVGRWFISPFGIRLGLSGANLLEKFHVQKDETSQDHERLKTHRHLHEDLTSLYLRFGGIVLYINSMHKSCMKSAIFYAAENHNIMYTLVFPDIGNGKSTLSSDVFPKGT